MSLGKVDQLSPDHERKWKANVSSTMLAKSLQCAQLNYPLMKNSH